MYVEQLSGGPARLADDIEAADRFEFCWFHGDAGDAGADSAMCWPRLSSGVGVAVALVADGDMLEHVHFSRLAKAVFWRWW